MLLPENAVVVDAFLLAQTQLRYDSKGFPRGLDYAGVEAGARLRGETFSAELFCGMQVMEIEWCRAFADSVRRLSEKPEKETRH